MHGGLQHLPRRDSPSRSRSRRRGPARSSGRWRASRAEPSSIRSQQKMPGWLSQLPSPTGCSPRGRASSPAARRRSWSTRTRGNGTWTACRRGRAPCATCFSRLAAPSSLEPAQTSVPPGSSRPSRARCWRSSPPCAWSAAQGRAATAPLSIRGVASVSFRKSGPQRLLAGRCPRTADPRRAERTPAVAASAPVSKAWARARLAWLTEPERRVP